MYKVLTIQYEKAKKTVQKYLAERSRELIKPHTCICCKKNKISIVDFERDYAPDPTNQQGEFTKSGVIEKILCGYGSKHDTTCFYIAICDECITDLIKNNHVQDFKEIYKQFKKIK